jgi:tetratricopeptide (TPR) repeat protein
MNSRLLILSFIGIVAAFAGGFLLANALNRSEIESLKAQNSRLVETPASTREPGGAADLSDEEIQAKIKQADSDPTNFQFQKNLGIALSKYASAKQDAKLLSEASRLIDRAVSINAKDRDLLVAQGNAHFDIGMLRKDNAELDVARHVYEVCLKTKPDDPDVRTDLGLTYFLYEPPDLETAIAEFKRSLSVDPNHEKTLEFLIQALTKQQKPDEARQYLAKLKSAHPDSEAITGLSSLIAGDGTTPLQ